MVALSGDTVRRTTVGDGSVGCGIGSGRVTSGSGATGALGPSPVQAAMERANHPQRMPRTREADTDTAHLPPGAGWTPGAGSMRRLEG
jgi:hypothetical protein